MVTPFLPFKKEGVVAYLAKNCVGERMGIALSCSTREPYAVAKSRYIAATSVSHPAQQVLQMGILGLIDPFEPKFFVVNDRFSHLHLPHWEYWMDRAFWEYCDMEQRCVPGARGQSP